jgi:hypothetical protein
VGLVLQPAGIKSQLDRYIKFISSTYYLEFREAHLSTSAISSSAKFPGISGIKISQRGNDERLNDVACGSPQWVDVADWLLDQGVFVQQKVPPKDRLELLQWNSNHQRYSTKGRVDSPWNPLRQAVQGGNEKIVRLLLERGADPNATDSDVLEQAVRRGRLEIVHMLVEHGA